MPSAFLHELLHFTAILIAIRLHAGADIDCVGLIFFYCIGYIVNGQTPCKEKWSFHPQNELPVKGLSCAAAIVKQDKIRRI